MKQQWTADVDEALASFQSDGRACASPGPTMASTHYNIADSVEKFKPDREIKHAREITHAKAKRMEELAEIEAREKQRA